MQIQNIASNQVAFTNKTKVSNEGETSELSNFKEQLDATVTIHSKGDIPSWVDSDYSYDPQNPRKPNMRELMEYLSGKSTAELYANPNIDLSALANQAADILYGVVGNADDTRDWTKIMESDNILDAARLETARLHEPMIDIENQVEMVKKEDGIVEAVIVDQFPVIRAKTGAILSSNIKGNDNQIATELKRFGGNEIKFNSDILLKIVVPNFNTQQLNNLQRLIMSS